MLYIYGSLASPINTLISDSTPEEHTAELHEGVSLLTIDNSFSAYLPGTHFTPKYSEDVEKAHSQGLRLTWLSPGIEPGTSQPPVYH